MIKNISELKNKNADFFVNYIKNCDIEEKIDAHYISVSILSEQAIVLKKASGKEITRVDMILNSMWNNLFIDWNFLLFTNKEWFADHKGYKIYMFYLPCEKPISTEYPAGLRYIVDKIEFAGDQITNIDNFLGGITFPQSYTITYKKPLTKKRICADSQKIKELWNISIKSDNWQNLFDVLVDADGILAKDNRPEGIIFRNKKSLYQLPLNGELTTAEPKERTSFEYVLCNFAQYCASNDYKNYITQSYIKTVCAMFNDFIINDEKNTNNIAKNINPENIESPNIGKYFDINYDYIPDPITKNLCKTNTLYKNIYKVLLANLQRGKDYTHCVYMSKKQVDAWNNIVKNIKLMVTKE